MSVIDRIKEKEKFRFEKHLRMASINNKKIEKREKIFDELVKKEKKKQDEIRHKLKEESEHKMKDEITKEKKEKVCSINYYSDFYSLAE